MTSKASLLVIAFVGTAFAQGSATSVHIANPGFETDELFCPPSNECTQFAVTGWSVGPLSGVYKPTTTQYPGGAPEGRNVAFIGGAANGTVATGSISQTLRIALQANRTYTLRLSVGQRADYPLIGYVASLVAGDIPLASDSSLSPAPGTFLEDVIVYKSGANSPLLGEPLGIFVKGFGANAQVNIDNFSLTVE
jgi:hypothetical protein